MQNTRLDIGEDMNEKINHTNEVVESKGKSGTLYNRVYNEILKMIIEGQIKPNELLPSEGEIADKCGVSKMTSKLALNTLAEEKIIYRIPRRGSFLADVDLNKIRSMVDTNGTPINSASRINYLALIIPKIDSYCGNIVKEIIMAADDYNYQVIVKYSDGKSDKEEQILAELAKLSEIKGVILFPSDYNVCGVELLNYKICNYPIVIVDRVYKEIEFDSICHDHYQGAKDAVNYLIGKGHSKIGFISRSITNVTSREERYQGYVAGMMEGNKRIRNESVRTNDYMVMETLKEYLLENETLTAVLCADDYLAIYLYYATQELGKSIPEDISIIGFSDNEILNYIPKKMTTVRQPVNELCMLAVKGLIDKISNSNTTPKSIRISTEIIERDSVRQL